MSPAEKLKTKSQCVTGKHGLWSCDSQNPGATQGRISDLPLPRWRTELLLLSRNLVCVWSGIPDFVLIQNLFLIWFGVSLRGAAQRTTETDLFGLVHPLCNHAARTHTHFCHHFRLSSLINNRESYFNHSDRGTLIPTHQSLSSCPRTTSTCPSAKLSSSLWSASQSYRAWTRRLVVPRGWLTQIF